MRVLKPTPTLTCCVYGWGLPEPALRAAGLAPRSPRPHGWPQSMPAGSAAQGLRSKLDMTPGCPCPGGRTASCHLARVTSSRPVSLGPKSFSRDTWWWLD